MVMIETKIASKGAEKNNSSRKKVQTGAELWKDISAKVSSSSSEYSLMQQKKAIPNYLRPTLSSCGSTSCNYPTKQQQKLQVITKRPIIIRASSYPSSSQLKDTHKSLKTNTSTTTTTSYYKQKQSINIIPDDISKKSFGGRPQLRAAAKKIMITPPTTSWREAAAPAEEKVEKVISVDTVGGGIVVITSPPKNKMKKQVDLRQVKDFSNKVHNNYNYNYNYNINNNEVIEEELARKVGESDERRNKVKALVGAFETVIFSLHEPAQVVATQHSPQRGDHIDEVKIISQPSQQKDPGSHSTETTTT